MGKIVKEGRTREGIKAGGASLSGEEPQTQTHEGQTQEKERGPQIYSVLVPEDGGE